MSLKLIPAFAISLGLGFGLGFVPVLNELLHFQTREMFPISSLFFGVLVGSLQFWVSYTINQKVGGWTISLLAIFAVIGYATVDYGIYFTTLIPIKGIVGIPDGEYRLFDIVPFSDYMKWRLDSSTVSTGIGRKLLEMGSLGTTFSYLFDLVGSFLGSAVALLIGSKKYPYCERCSKFKKRERKYEIVFDYDEDTRVSIFGRIAELVGKENYTELVSCFRELSETHPQNVGDVEIVVDQRFCPSCREATIIGNINRREKREWKEVVAFSFTSKIGEHRSFHV